MVSDAPTAPETDGKAENGARVRRRWPRRLAGLAGGVLVGLVLAECGARIAWRAERPAEGAGGPGEESGASIHGPHMRNDPELGFRLDPGFSALVVEPETRAQVRINRFGLRGPEPDLTRSPRDRWLVLGDSFVSALQVEQEETFVALLDRKLEGEVLNAGVDAYSTYQATRWYRRVDDRLPAGQALLLFYVGNDPIDNLRGLDFQASPEPEGLRGKDYAAILAERYRARHPLLRHSRLYSRLRLRWGLLGSPHDNEEFQFEVTYHTVAAFLDLGGGEGSLLEPTEAALRELRDATAGRGDRLIVALAPDLTQVDAGDREVWASEMRRRGRDPGSAAPDTITGAIRGILDALDVPHCDLSPALAEAEAGGEACYYRINRHWTPAGHRVAADALARCIGVGPGQPATHTGRGGR